MSPSHPGRAPLAARRLLTANIRLKRNSRYLTQVMPPDTIFVTLTVCTELRETLNRTSHARERQGKIRFYTLLYAENDAIALFSVSRLASDPPPFSLFFSLSLAFFPYVNDPNSTGCSRVDCPPSNAPNNVFLLLRGIHSRCARNRPARAVLSLGRRGTIALFSGKNIRGKVLEKFARRRLNRNLLYDFNVVSL